MTSSKDTQPNPILSDKPTQVFLPTQSLDSIDAVIKLDQVKKIYKTESVSVEALRGINLDIGTSEFVAIMGASGSGKSTLMHIMGCLDIPTYGRYVLAGQDVSTLNEVQLASARNKQIGFVFQAFNLLTGLNAAKNVELPLMYGGVSPKERHQRALESLEAVSMGNRASHKPGELSGGQQQRIAIARALVTQPAIILADEPTGNLDSASTNEILDIFTQLNNQGRTVVLITHEDEVAAVANRIVRLKDGLVISDEMVSK